MLEVTGLTKSYGSLLAVDELSVRIERGEFVTLLGPSGCGKSTTLHAIAGLVEPTAGTVSLRGEDVTDTSPNDRNIGFVFQHSALFPHMTAAENIEYGLTMQGFDAVDHDEQVDRFLELVQLSDHHDHSPSELSGGQQRRLSLARALAYEPDILLLDEPLTGLDRVLREEMRNEIRTIQQEVGVTTLNVTHDQAEALSMSDRVVVMNEGKREQVGSPKELYRNPASEFVAEFVGQSTRFCGRLPTDRSRRVATDGSASADEAAGDVASSAVDDPKESDSGTESRTLSVVTDCTDERGTIEVEIDRSRLDGLELGAREELSLYVRPESIDVEPLEGSDPARVLEDSDPAPVDGSNAFTATVRTVEYLGHRNEVEASLADGKQVTAYADSTHDIRPEDAVRLRFDPTDVIVV
ncbi:ABC transporter ATP-binding protein [Halostagnicola bangensis]